MKRDAHIDAAKGILIALVVFGHVLEAMDPWRDDAVRAWLTFIYNFHMPAFAFLAGVTAPRGRSGDRTTNLLILLCLFQAISMALWLNLPPWRTFDLASPFWTLWFLLALVWWQGLAGWIRRAPRSALAISVLAALAAGTCEFFDDTLALSRTLVFLPFFTAGAAWGASLFDRARRMSLPHSWLLTSGALLISCTVVSFGVERHWLFGSHGYAELGVDFLEGIATRTLLTCVAATMTCVVIAWATRIDRGPLCTAGRYSLSVYLLHGPLVMLLQPEIRGMFVGDQGPAAWSLCLLLTIGLLALLSRPEPDRCIRRSVTVLRAAIAYSRTKLRTGSTVGRTMTRIDDPT